MTFSYRSPGIAATASAGLLDLAKGKRSGPCRSRQLTLCDQQCLATMPSILLVSTVGEQTPTRAVPQLTEHAIFRIHTNWTFASITVCLRLLPSVAPPSLP